MPDYEGPLLHEPTGRRRKYRIRDDCPRDERKRHKTVLLSISPLMDEEESESPISSPLAGPGPGGHKPSFKSTKLARRARSFKDDFLGKISQMRSPAGPGGARSHSPKGGRSPKPADSPATAHNTEHSVYHRHGGAKGPVQELDDLWKQTQIALKHFRDVVAKQKLEMLPGNGTIVLDTVWLINLSVKSSVSSDSSSSIISATNHMYQSVARLIKLCDDALIDDKSAELSKDNVNEIVAQVEDAVQDLIRLLVVGGRDGLKTLNTMECLDMETGTWTQLSPMNTHRHGLGVAVLGGTLYAVGGHDGWSYLSNVERWDSVTRSWSYVAPMQSQRCSAGVAVLKGKLYAVGGRDGASCLRTVECYDPHTNKWIMCAPLTRRRGGVGVAVANGFLYALGGQDAPANNPAACRFNCVERYDPSTDTWTVIASLSSRRDAVAACLFGDRLVAVGGYDGNHYLRTVEQYDPNTNEWSNLAPLVTGRAGACVIAMANAKVQSTD